MVAFPGGQILDVVGPLEVFSSTTRYLAANGRPGEGYDIEIVGRAAGPVQMSSGLELVVRRAVSRVRGDIDTLMVAGGEGTREALADAALLRGIRRLATRARRVASVCTGAFLLAEAGLLDGRRATTHWRSCARFGATYPTVQVEPDSIYVRDGDVYTSAGVTAGIDLALALVEDDYGRDIALATARNLVVFLSRPGGQSQFSAALASQSAERKPLRDVQAFVVEHPADDLSVPALAERAGMSPRNFARAFTAEVGDTPARFVERVRVEAARRRLEHTDDGIDTVAAACGFGTAETMRRAFHRTVRVSPAAYRARFESEGERT